MAPDIPFELRRRSFDWNLLHTYMAIANEGSITAAAARLQLQQPTISNALKRLETQLGARLVERGSGHFELTPQGKALFLECQEICGAIGRLDQLLKHSHQQLDGHLRLYTASHVVFPPLDRALTAFHAAHPQASLAIEVETSSNVIRAMLGKNATLGICLISELNPRLHYQRLFREYFGFFCGPSHPLFGCRDLSLQDLRGVDFVSFDTDRMSDALRPVAQLRAQLQVPARVVGTSASLEEVRRMISSGLGVGPLPIHVAAREVKDGLLWRLPPYKQPPAIDIFLVTNPRTRLSRTERAFINTLLEYADGTADMQPATGAVKVTATRHDGLLR